MFVTPKTKRIVVLDPDLRAMPAGRRVCRRRGPSRGSSGSLIVLSLTLSVLGIAAYWVRSENRIAVASGVEPERTVQAQRTAETVAPAVERGSSLAPRGSAMRHQGAGETETVAEEFPEPGQADQAESSDSRTDGTPELGQGREQSSPEEEIALGRALFNRHWRPDDPRCHGGDGLGPVFNATSCLDCHRQGGPGGGGPSRTNAVLVSVVGRAVRRARPQGVLPGRYSSDNAARYVVSGFTGNGLGDEARAHLIHLHPGFADTQSIVLHRFGVDSGYGAWRQQLTNFLVAHRMESFAGRRQPSHTFAAGLIHNMALHMSQRNPSALFGAGLIDALPDQVLYEASWREPPQIRGRVSRTRDGGVGRFGWKAQTGTLHDFVLAACANELGLEVPGQHQAASPLAPGAAPKGLDLTGEDCDALVAYVRSLPSPVVVEASGLRESTAVEDGRRLFTAIGCSECHTPSMGDVQGIYSDLLLHDMGESLGDPGSYYGSAGSPGASTRSEWRTPPLWGVRDSGPYLHDGRAQTLENAVLQHGGQGAVSAVRFEALDSRETSQVRAFLNTLAAPAPDNTIEVTPEDVEPFRPDPTAVDLTHRIEAKLRLGQSLERMGKPEGALNFYREIVRQCPDSAASSIAAGRIAALTRSRGNQVPADRAAVLDVGSASALDRRSSQAR